MDFWFFWEHNRDGLYKRCLDIMKNWDEAEDALSAAMLHAREKIVIHAPNIGNFKGWLYQLTENVCLALLRKRKKQDIYDDRIEGVIAKNKLVTNFLESPEDKYQREDVLEAIYKAVKPLPQHLREAAMPRFFLKMSYRDIALILGITNDNVRKRIQQARAILARELKGLRGAPSALSHLGEKKNNNSPAWSKIIKEVDEALYAGKKELEFLCNATAIVKIYLPVGIEKDIPVFLRRKPGRYKARLKTLKEYVTKYPGGWKKRLELAEIFYALGDWYRAVKELSQVVGVHPQSLYARVLLGQVLLYTGESEKAAKIYKETTLFVYKESSKYLLSGMVELCHRRPEEAAGTFKKGVAIDPGSETLQQTLAFSLLQAGYPMKALQAFEKIIENNPRDPVSLTHSYELLTAVGLLQRAEDYVNRMLELFPDDLTALARRIVQRCSKGQVQGEEGEKTRRILRSLKRMGSHIALVHEAVAVYHFYRGEWSQALSVLEIFTAEHPNNLEGWRLYSQWLFRTAHYREAVEALGRIRKKYKPGQTEPFMLWQLNQKEEELQKVDTPGAYINHARELFCAGDYSQAIVSLNSCCRILPDKEFCTLSVDSSYLLAQCYIALKQKKEARESLREVISGCVCFRNYKPAEADYMEGKALLGMGDTQGAARVFTSALASNLPYPARKHVGILKNRFQMP